MFRQVMKSILPLGIGILLVYFLKDPIIALLVGLVIVAIIEVIDKKILHK